MSCCPPAQIPVCGRLQEIRFLQAWPASSPLVNMEPPTPSFLMSAPAFPPRRGFSLGIGFLPWTSQGTTPQKQAGLWRPACNAEEHATHHLLPTPLSRRASGRTRSYMHANTSSPGLVVLESCSRNCRSRRVSPPLPRDPASTRRLAETGRVSCWLSRQEWAALAYRWLHG